MDITLEKTLPNNLEAERVIIGANILAETVTTFIDPTHFYLDSHRKIIETMNELSSQGRPCDIITLKDRLQQKNELEAVGGAAYLCSLTDGLPRMEMSQHHWRIVKRESALRSLIRIANEAMIRSYQDEEEPKIIIEKISDECDQILEMTSEVPGLVHVSSYLSPLLTEIEARSDRKISADSVPTGYNDLDRLLSGGIRLGNDNIIAGRPSSGKTAFLLNMMRNIALKGTPTAFFSIEMGALEVIERIIASVARVDGQRIRTGFLNREDWNRLTNAMSQISEMPFYIDDSTGITVEDIRSRIRRLKGIIQVVGLDYMQLITPSGARKNANEYETITAISKGLKFMVKNMNVSGLFVSQLSRQTEKRTEKRPQLSDLRASGQLEQDADVVMFIHREEMFDPTEQNAGEAELIIGKQRNGPVGDIKLAFAKQFSSFDSLYSEY